MAVPVEDAWTDWTDDEVLEVLSEHYYTLSTTGEQAVVAVVYDIINNRFWECHGIDDERMWRILAMFARTVKDGMDISAMEFYLTPIQESGNG